MQIKEEEKLAKKKSSRLKAKEKPLDFILVITVLIMLSFGIVMVLSASSPWALAESGKSYSYVKTQGFSAILGLILMYIISKIDYRRYKNLDKVAYVVSLILLAAVLIPGLGKDAKGAVRWLNLKFISFQPSEVAKIGLVVFYAGYLTKNRENIGKLWEGFIRPILFLAPVLVILIFVQSHLSASVLIILIVAIMMLMSGSKLRYFLTFGSIGAMRRSRNTIHTCKILR